MTPQKWLAVVGLCLALLSLGLNAYAMHIRWKANRLAGRR